MRKTEKVLKILCTVLAVAICGCLLALGIQTGAFKAVFDKDGEKPDKKQESAASTRAERGYADTVNISFVSADPSIDIKQPTETEIEKNSFKKAFCF